MLTANRLRTLGFVALFFLLLQLVRPQINYPPATEELQASPAVSQVLKNSCYPCHSNERRLSWFDQIVPAYWFVAHDVAKARKHVNFSELGTRSEAQQRATLFQAVNFIEKGVMPLRSYTGMHPEAVVSASQLAILKNYLLPRNPLFTTAASKQIADAQYRTWITSSGKPEVISPSPNGLAFVPAYKNWKFVNSTVRFDANTMRVILCNEVAEKAIADNKTNPWPDGSVLAKVGWFQQLDKNGIIRPGAFFKVGFMIKDSRRYGSTAGWGWAEWSGTEHKPYGDGPGFATECVTCRDPQRKSDFIYTTPIKLTGHLEVNPLLWTVITSEAEAGNSTMSTLFGNGVAVQYSRTHADGMYPEGSVLSPVTWRQQEDVSWFGARMPAETKSMEIVTAGVSGYHYERYEGSTLNAVEVSQGQTEERISYLRSQRAAVMP